MEEFWVTLPYLLLTLNSAHAVIQNCGNAIGIENGAVNLSCNTLPAYEISWGSRVGNDPVPVLMVVEPSGSRDGSQINSTTYYGRLSFFGNITAGITSFRIAHLKVNDSGEYIWVVDPIAGGGLKKYTMSLDVNKAAEITPTPTPTTSPTSSLPSSPSPAPTLPSTTTSPTTTATPPEKLKLWHILLISFFGIIVLVALILIVCCCCCLQYLTDCYKWVCCCCPCKDPIDCYNRCCCCCPCKIKVEGSSESEQSSEMKSKPPSAEK